MTTTIDEETGFIRFVEGQPKPKTKTWTVIAKDGDIPLGQISWYGRWRGYTFEPHEGTIFEQRCLRGIAQFIETQNKLQRQKAKGIEP